MASFYCINCFFFYRANIYKAICSKYGNKKASTLEVAVKSTEVTIANLEQQTDYNCWVVAVANEKDGDISSLQKIRTKPVAAPEVKIFSIGSTTVTLTWKEVVGLVLVF